MTTWAEVQTNPEYQKLPAERKEAARKQYFDEMVAPKVPKEKLSSVRAQFDKDTTQQAAPAPAQPQRSEVAAMGDMNPIAGLAETGMNMATGIAALPVEAAASTYKLATAPWGKKAEEAAKASEGVRESMIYQPQTTIGKGMTKAVGTVLGIPGEIGEAAESAVQNRLEGKGIPKTAMVAEVGARLAPEVAATLLGARVGGKLRARAAPGEAAAEAARQASVKAAPDVARQYLESKTGYKWDELPQGLKDKLTIVARDPESLKKLEPETIEREARAERLNMPISRGDAARNLGQQTREDLVKKVGDENPIRDMRSAQDTALHGAMDEVRKSTGAIAKTGEQIGESVQDEGIRGKKAASKSAYDAAFDKARATEPKASVSADPLYEALAKNPDIQELGFLEKWLKKAQIEQKGEGPGAPVQLSTDIGKALKARAKGGKSEEVLERRPIPLTELQHLRETAAGIARSAHGSEKYFAGKLVKAIDKSFDKIPAAAKAWKEARDLFKAHQKEFEEQGIIKALGDNKRNSSDRRVDVEKTVAKVLKSSKADIGALKKTLTTGGTQATRGAGTRAWRNIQAGVLDALKKKAEGKRGIKGEKGQAQFGSQFLDLFNELEANGKIDAIFDAPQAAKLREIAKGVADVRTKADKGISGADTAMNLKVENTLSKLEKTAKLPWGGKYIAGVAKVAKGIVKAGETEREFANAKTTPVTEAAETASKAAKKSDKKARRSRNTLRGLRRAGPVAPPLTLQNQQDQQQK